MRTEDHSGALPAGKPPASYKETVLKKLLKKINPRVLLTHVIITLGYPAARAFTAEINRLQLFTDAMTIIAMAAVLVEAICFTRKNDGTPKSAATEKQTSCLFVRLNITLLFTFVRSRGTDIYDAAITVFLSFNVREGYSWRGLRS